MKLFSNIFIVATAVLASNVIELTEKNFKSVVVDSKIPTLVDIYASWCGHCKRLNPVYDELADSFSHAKGKIQIVKIDGDIHSKISKDYGVTGFPSIKFFDKDGSIEDVKVGRSLEALSGYISDKTGVQKKFQIPKASAVESLSDTNFDEIVGDKNKVAIVAFTAEWCGHCKNLKPIYKDLAEIFKDDEDVIIGEVDTSAGESESLQKRFQIKSYPTILVFPAGEIPESADDVEIYQGPRTIEAFTEHVNSLSGVNRSPDGSLNLFAGRYDTLDKIAKEFVKADVDDRATLRERIVKFMVGANKEGKKLAEEASKQYLKIAEKIESNEGYLEKELKRLSNILSRGGLKKSKSDELTKKLNIIKVFLNKADSKKESINDEL